MKMLNFSNRFLTIISLFLLLSISNYTTAFTLDSTIIDSVEDNNIIISRQQQWNHTYGGILSDGWSHGQQTSDGGYVLAGYTYSYSKGKEDIWLLKTDEQGQEIWNTSFGGVSHDEALSVIETADLGYLIVGKTYSQNTQSTDAWIIKTDSKGTMIWNITYGGSDIDIGRYVQEIDNGDFIVSGITKTFDKTGCFLLRISNSGTILWNQTYMENFPYSLMNVFHIKQTNDQGFLLAGQIHIQQGIDGFLLKTNETGEIIWFHTYGGSHTDFFKSFHIAKDEIILIGTTNSFDSKYFDVWLVKTDLNGSELWNVTFGGALNDEGFSLDTCEDNGYILTGYTYSKGNGYSDIWVIKTNHEGIYEWDEVYGSSSRDSGNFIMESDNRDIIVIGTYDGDGWMININQERIIQTKPIMMIGQIKEVELKDNYSTFKADGLLILEFTPIDIGVYTSGEMIYILKEEKAIRYDTFVFGIFQAGIDESINN